MRKGEDYTGIAVVYYCHDGEGNVLMSKRNENCRDEHGRWDIGGGGVEFGAKIEDTLRQEIMEEYCTDVIAHEFLGYRDVHRDNGGKPTHWIALDFKVLVDRSKAAIGEPHKFDSLDWFKPDAFPDPVHSQFPTFFELYRDRLIQ